MLNKDRVGKGSHKNLSVKVTQKSQKRVIMQPKCIQTNFYIDVGLD